MKEIFNRSMYLAVVSTDYEIYAIADTEAKARRNALVAAREWLAMSDIKYKSLKELEEWIGCNVFPLSQFGVGQEG